MGKPVVRRGRKVAELLFREVAGLQKRKEMK